MTVNLEMKEFFNFWTKVQESILYMASLLEPEDLKYTFDSKLHPVGETFDHIAGAINGWLTFVIEDGEKNPAKIPTEKLTVESINETLKNAFTRVKKLLNTLTIDDWNKTLTDKDDDGKSYQVKLHWVLWHLIEHDIHHRTQLKLQYSFLNKKIDEKIFWEENYFLD